jgi:hypothetical protein
LVSGPVEPGPRSLMESIRGLAVKTKLDPRFAPRQKSASDDQASPYISPRDH